MGQGRGCAIVVATMLLLCMAVTVHAAKFTVGDAAGWTFNVVNWPNAKKFAAGDVLVFNYNPAIHDVVVVKKEDYDACKAPGDAKVFQSGKDEITLVKGDNFFLCNKPGHCAGGVKIAVTAA